jgi:hypothetical protein
LLYLQRKKDTYRKVLYHLSFFLSQPMREARSGRSNSGQHAGSFGISTWDRQSAATGGGNLISEGVQPSTAQDGTLDTLYLYLGYSILAR